jgi:hypothetical protein
VVEPTNAWDRAQQAIARAQQRNGTVVTPDNAESPFDASATQMIPTPQQPNGRPMTQGGRPGPAPAPRPSADGRRSGRGRDPYQGQHGRPYPSEPETTPVEVSDPTLMRPLHPVDPPTVRTASTRPRTAPFPAQGQNQNGAQSPAQGRHGAPQERGPGPDDTPTTPPVGIRVPWWKRLFGRG